MPTAHYIPLSALADNGLHPSNPNRTIETAPRLDVNVPRSNPQFASNNIGNDPRTMDVTTNGLSLPAIRSNSDSTANNDQQNKKNYTRFNDRVAALREYKEKNGHLSVSKKDDESLYNWCTHIRRSRNKPGEGTMKLTADRIATLDAIGFDWRSETKASSWISFIDRVEALRQYKEKHGHLSVTLKANESLYCWCANIRSVRRGKLGKCKIKLTQERIAALDAIGFDWRWSKSVSQPFNSLVDDADKASGKSEESCFCYDQKR